MVKSDSTRKPFVPPKLERLNNLVQLTGFDDILPPVS